MSDPNGGIDCCGDVFITDIQLAFLKSMGDRERLGNETESERKTGSLTFETDKVRQVVRLK